MVGAQAAHQKTKFWQLCQKIAKKSGVKDSIKEPILLNFVNLSTIFDPRL